MKIKLSKSQWEKMGEEAGWMKQAQPFQPPRPNINIVDKTQQQPQTQQPQTLGRLQKIKSNKPVLDNFVMKLQDLQKDLATIGSVALNLIRYGEETNDAEIKGLGESLAKVQDGIYGVLTSQGFSSLNKSISKV